MIRNFGHWLEKTPLSVYFQDAAWIIPTSQSVHILCIGIVFSSAAMISLRVLGVGNSHRSLATLAGTLVPWMFRALAVLLVTGVIQTIAEPMRQLVTPEFWLKMLMILCVTALTAWFASSIRRNAQRWDRAVPAPMPARIFAVLSLLLWIGIIACGRLIAYTYSFYL